MFFQSAARFSRVLAGQNAFLGKQTLRPSMLLNRRGIFYTQRKRPSTPEENMAMAIGLVAAGTMISVCLKLGVFHMNYGFHSEAWPMKFNYHNYDSLRGKGRPTIRRFSSIHQKGGYDNQENLFLALGVGLLGGTLVWGIYSGVLSVGIKKSTATDENKAGKAAKDSPAVAEITDKAVTEEEPAAEGAVADEPVIPPLPAIPESVPYILVGGGTASFAAYRAIRKADPTAK
ncbi:predicted protein, partial [Nematostella vectensis]